MASWVFLKIHGEGGGGGGGDGKWGGGKKGGNTRIYEILLAEGGFGDLLTLAGARSSRLVIIKGDHRQATKVQGYRDVEWMGWVWLVYRGGAWN